MELHIILQKGRSEPRRIRDVLRSATRRTTHFGEENRYIPRVRTLHLPRVIFPAKHRYSKGAHKQNCCWPHKPPEWFKPHVASHRPFTRTLFHKKVGLIE